ncbi:transmembrane protein [Segniliparus rotundus DSM 44985]|uniref:Transmembrane protein n=1 Tax=Segniliparus rotundus (strain ATCC BAA-972 / CDC 1076 / CIP 108378 / DSM 44985 / JCM 13578) TaxID=640132 RepID=D6ZCG6_SEGRD|nr:rhomboid-like protein [Segniliparus rotundus]ADG97008.1 transmembrane protein [Segniliparus rotundus DSM 44985]
MTSLAQAAPLRWAARFPVTLCYVLGLAAVAFFQRGLSDARGQQLVSQTSTNLRNLAEGRWLTLLESAFVTQEDPSRIWVWLPGFACLLALGEWIWRSRRLAGAIVLSHVGGTALVALGLVVALRLGWAESSVVDDDDVGVSYASMGAFGALIGAVPRALRLPWAAWWLAAAALALWRDRDFTSAGHLVSLCLGLMAGAWFARGGERTRWTPLMLCLAAVAFVFSFDVLVDVRAFGFDPQAPAASPP